MREYYRPYSKVVGITDGTATTVNFNDTSGALLKCNYVTVTSVSGGQTEGMFSVIPSGLHNIALTASSQPHVSSLSGITTSGITGLVANTGGGSVVLSLAPYDSVSHVIISQDNTTYTAYAVTYGVVNLANPRADDALGNSIGN